MADELRPVPDDLPRRQLYREPIRVAGLDALQPERLEGGRVRVTFEVTIRDDAGTRCPDLAVEARIRGPERAAAGMAHTDGFGQVWFRMEGPSGQYLCEVLDVAAGAIQLTRATPDVVAELLVEV